MKKKKLEIDAVHRSDIRQFLESIEEYEKVKKGEIDCKFCEIKIELEDIYAIFPERGEIKYCCMNCISEIM